MHLSSSPPKRLASCSLGEVNVAIENVEWSQVIYMIKCTIVNVCTASDGVHYSSIGSFVSIKPATINVQ